MQETVTHFGCVFYAVLRLCGIVALDHGPQLAVFYIASFLKAVHKGLKRIEAGLEGAVFRLEGFPAGTFEEIGDALRMRFGQGEQEK